MRTYARLGLLLAVFLGVALLARPNVGQAAFPGANGKIVFASDRDGNWEIYVMNADGSGQVNLTNNLADDESPAWSADGAKIAFFRECDIYVMNADGSGQTNLTNGVACDGQPAWSPDGPKIAFDSKEPGIPDAAADIYVMDADGDKRTNLTNDPASHDQGPAWSPDGSKIAFTNTGVDVMDADGDNRITLFGEGGIIGGAEWSPDGSKIAFDSDVDGDREIYVMDADGSGRTPLTDNEAQDGLPNWGPLAPVGGLAELPDASGSAGSNYVALAALAAALVALGAGGWYARRRRLG